MATAPWPRLQREMHGIPIVLPGWPDPVSSGFVASLARPGGNVTGFTTFEGSNIGKLAGLLKEIAPGITRVAMILAVDFAGKRRQRERDRYGGRGARREGGHRSGQGSGRDRAGD